MDPLQRTFKIYPIFNSWVHCGQVLSVPTMYSPCSHWVYGSLSSLWWKWVVMRSSCCEQSCLSSSWQAGSAWPSHGCLGLFGQWLPVWWHAGYQEKHYLCVIQIVDWTIMVTWSWNNQRPHGQDEAVILCYLTNTHYLPHLAAAALMTIKIPLAPADIYYSGPHEVAVSFVLSQGFEPMPFNGEWIVININHCSWPIWSSVTSGKVKTKVILNLCLPGNPPNTRKTVLTGNSPATCQCSHATHHQLAGAYQQLIHSSPHECNQWLNSLCFLL